MPADDLLNAHILRLTALNMRTVADAMEKDANIRDPRVFARIMRSHAEVVESCIPNVTVPMRLAVCA